MTLRHYVCSDRRRASDVQECRSLCTACRPGEWLWIDSNGINGKPTFRRRANQSWCSATCNHFAVIAAWSRWRCSCKSWPFWKKTPYGQIFTNVFPKGSPSLRSTSCGQILWNLAHQKLVKSCIIYVKKKTKFWLTSAWITPKICQTIYS